jgi:putative nucleotidyltransferase with HDIG domain
MAEIIVSAEEILESVRSVPALSPGASHLLEVIGTGVYEVPDIVKVIEADSAMTANVLKVVNSAAMGLRREITSVHQAVAFLGDTKIIGIALTSTGGETFNAELRGYAGNRGDLGRHCLWVAIAARELARHTDGKVDKGVAFTAGLLHDIGKAVISDFMVELAPRIVARASDDAFGDHLEAERQVMGTDHCEVGCRLARHWMMPEALIQGIEFHHRPSEAPEEFKPMAYVIHLADTLAMMQGTGTGLDDLQYDMDSEYTHYVNLDSPGLEGLALDVQFDFMATAEALFGEQQETEE